MLYRKITADSLSMLYKPKLHETRTRLYNEIVNWQI